MSVQISVESDEGGYRDRERLVQLQLQQQLQQRDSDDIQPRLSSLQKPSTPTSMPGVISRVEKAKRGSLYFMLAAMPVVMLAILIYMLMRPVSNSDPYILANAVKPAALWSHLEALQNVANLHNGSRSVVHGYNASADYVMSKLRSVGLSPYKQPFDMSWFEELAPPTLQLVQPTATVYTAGTDFLSLSYSGSGMALNVALAVARNLGCDASDFVGIAAGSAVLVRRGACPFADKAEFALGTGAVAVLVYNDGVAASVVLFRVLVA
jgi:hypothetical protein